MKQKRSKKITLLLVTGLLFFSACSQSPRPRGMQNGRRLHMRSDSTSSYSSTRSGGAGMRYAAFRPYSMRSSGGSYARGGYESRAISKSSNAKSSSVRGGFGSSGRVSAS